MLKFESDVPPLVGQCCSIFRCFAVSVATFIVCLATFNAAASDLSVMVEHRGYQAGASAILRDQGDYYFGTNGDVIRFLRKQDVYAVELTANADRLGKTNDAFSVMKSEFGDRVEKVEQHQLGNVLLVRLNNAEVNKKNSDVGSSTSGVLTPQMLVSGNGFIDRLVPVLANSKGQGDILVSSKLLFRLKDGVNPGRVISELETEHDISVDRRLNAPGFVYSASFDGLSTSESFELVRGVSESSTVLWAQPQFKAKAFKHSFEPSDPLYSNQWHLQNKGFEGSRCDTDCDANNAWDIGNANGVGGVSGNGMVIAIIDDGVQTDHEDLNVWTNSGEVGSGKEFNGIDDDANGYIDDWRGWDFVDDSSNSLVALSTGVDCHDGDLGVDNNPNPNPDADCGFNAIEPVEQDNHGTAVAGLAAAQSNTVGVVGSAFSAQVLALRLVSDFDGNPNSDFCARVVEAMTYAGRYADVINNSWGMDEGTCPALDEVMGLIADGALTENSVDVNNELVQSSAINISKRENYGSPIVFSSGNSASGWVKVTVTGITAGQHAYEWRLLRSDFPADFDIGDDNVVYLDKLTLPGGDTETFESGTGLNNFSTACAVNDCADNCVGLSVADLTEGCPQWSINTDPQFVFEGSQSAKIEAESASGDGFCAYSYLHLEHDGDAGSLSFWVWVNTDAQQFSDKFEFLIDGVEILSYGDLPRLVNNSVGYPANSVVGSGTAATSKVIAVGASNSGDLSGMSTMDLSAESRSHYSQYGPFLDVLAPSSDQHLGVFTTDRYGSDGVGYNATNDIGGTAAADPNYTASFGGTSASAPIVAGIAAAMIASDPSNDITSSEIEIILRRTADKIGYAGAASYADTDADGNTRSDFYGYGRVNMFGALKEVTGLSGVDSSSCVPSMFTYTPITDLLLPSLSPQTTEFCSAKGALIIEDDVCFPIIGEKKKIAVVCL